MLFSVELVIDIPYSSFSRNIIELEADGPEDLVLEAIPKRACAEFAVLRETVWKIIGWKHVNMKFGFDGTQIEIVIDQEKKSVAAVYVSNWTTGALLSQSESGVPFTDDADIAGEVARQAAGAGILAP